MKIIGFKRSDFTTKDGVAITGYNVYVANEIAPNQGKGVQVDRIYLSDNKIAREKIDLDALLEREVRILYNRFAKPDSISLID